MPEYQRVLLDRRSLEGKKRGKPRTDLSSKQIWLPVWDQQTLRELRERAWEKTPQGAGNGAAALKTGGEGGHHPVKQSQHSTAVLLSER